LCGILGSIGAVNQHRFRQALDLMEHRGPDAMGTHHRQPFSMGFRRLSIIDLSDEANQPMFTSDGRFGIIFNGEIYNFLEIKDELVELGYEFVTSGDTEVLLQAFKQWGPKCLDKLNGMFAFAVFDFVEEEVFIARDRLGIKPLYYLIDDGSFSFASEPKSLIHLSNRPFELNIDSLCSYLCFRYPVSGSSFFSGIESLPMGHWMKVKNGDIVQLERYWKLNDAFSLPKSGEADEQIELLRKKLESSVSKRMIADVPVGSYLSGGIDSSAITALMALNSNSPIHTFTIGFEEDGFNEFEFSRAVSEKFGTNHHEIVLDPQNYLANMEELIRIKDAPLGVPNEVPLFLMSKRLKKDITVVLSGEGADEIFGGYGRIFRSADDVKLINEWKDRDFESASDLGSRLRERYGGAFDSEIEMFLHLYRYTDLSRMNKLIGREKLENFLNGPTRVAFDRAFSEVEDQDFSTQMMYVFESLHLPGLLQRLDSTTMGASVEGRVPFVDHNLVEYAFTIPVELKMKWKEEPPEGIIGADSSEVFDTTKWILKQACSDVLPVEIIERKKLGFPVPLKAWFGSGIIDHAEKMIIHGRLVNSGLISAEGVREIIEEERNSGTESMLIWMLMNLEIFLDSFPDLIIPQG